MYKHDLTQGLVHIQGPLCVAVGFQDGALLCIDTDFVGCKTDGGTPFDFSIFIVFLTSSFP
jgi:hypothetical protein